MSSADSVRVGQSIDNPALGLRSVVLESTPEIASKARSAWLAALLSGRLDKHGNPRLTDLAVLMHRYPEDFFYGPVVPPVVQRAIAWPLAR